LAASLFVGLAVAHPLMPQSISAAVPIDTRGAHGLSR